MHLQLGMWLLAGLGLYQREALKAVQVMPFVVRHPLLVGWGNLKRCEKGHAGQMSQGNLTVPKCSTMKIL